jgi:DNA-binding NtrC family response regulator
MARILSVSYDESLLKTRELILEERRHQVVSALGFDEALKQCHSNGNFDLLVLGHSIPHAHKELLIAEFRSHCSAPVVALKRYGEQPVRGADFHIEPKPEHLLQVVAQLALPNQSSA